MTDRTHYMFEIIAILDEIGEHINPYASEEERIEFVIDTYNALNTMDTLKLNRIIEALEGFQDEEEESEKPNTRLLDLIYEAFNGLDHWLGLYPED